MDLLEHLRRQFAYDAWANREVLAILRKSSVDTSRSRQLLAHILAAERLWLERILQQPQTTPVWPELSWEKCELQIAALKQEWLRLLQGMTPARLMETVNYKNTKGELWVSNVGDIVTHVVMHSAYHRGQIAAQVRAHGETPAYTDFIQAVRTGQIE